MRKCVIRLHASRLGPGQMTERWPAGRRKGVWLFPDRLHLTQGWRRVRGGPVPSPVAGYRLSSAPSPIKHNVRKCQFPLSFIDT